MPVISLNAETAYCTKKNIVVPGPSSVAAAIATRAAARFADEAPSGDTVSLATPTVNAEATQYSQTLTSLG